MLSFRVSVTYCLGIWTRYGLVMASDSRTNAGHDQVNVARNMHLFEQPGERVFILLSSGSLSCTQSIVTQLRRDFGEEVRRVSDLDRAALERRVQIQRQPDPRAARCAVRVRTVPRLSPGQSTEASEDSPYVQIGETNYGRPIPDRGIRFDRTTLEEAAKYALLSLDSTMRSNVTVGPPIDLLAYGVDELEVTRRRRFPAATPTWCRSASAGSRRSARRWRAGRRFASAPGATLASRNPLRNRDDPARRAAQPVLSPRALRVCGSPGYRGRSSVSLRTIPAFRLFFRP